MRKSALSMSEKPSGIAHHAVIQHLTCISLSLSHSTVDATPHAIVAYHCTNYNHDNNVTFLSLSQAYTRHSLINC